MINRLLIDGIDVYSSFGVFVSNDGLNGVVEFPSIKPVETNDWQEEDGEEVDLSGIVVKPGLNGENDVIRLALESKIFNIQFIAHGQFSKCDDFILLLADKAYHNFQFSGINRHRILRMIDQPDLSLIGELGIFNISFADDFPVNEFYDYEAPQSTISLPGGYSLDNVSLSDYGVIVLKGLSEVRRSPAVKISQLTDALVINGLIYDENGPVVFKAKDVTFECLMKAPTTIEFWKNYDALLFDLTRPNERTLFIDAISREFPCYYKSCTTREFSYSNGVWWRFDLTLRVTTFKVNGEEFLLASESGEIIITEDGFAIDLNYNV